MVIDYEGSRAIPNNQILVKMERTLGKGVCVCVCVCVCVAHECIHYRSALDRGESWSTQGTGQRKQEESCSITQTIT